MISVIATFLLILLVLLIAIFPLTLSMSFFIGPPYLPTPKSVVREMLEITSVNKKDVIADLGSGDGIVLIESARKGAIAKGWEINPFLVIWTRILSRLKGVHKNVFVYAKAYQNADLRGVSVIFCYNMPKFMPSLEKKIRNEAKRNVKIVSYKFPIPGLYLIKKTKSQIFLYSLKK